VQVQTPQEEILHGHSLLIAPQRYTLMGKKQKKKVKKLCP